MNYRNLPKTDLQISEVSFGCMSLDLKKSDNEKLLRTAVDAGINYFDTADLYDKGANEELVGKALSPIRDQVVIATKVGNEWLPDGSSWQWNASKSYILEAVDKSLKRLKTDYIDIYQLHGGTMEDRHDEVVEAFQRLQEQGKIRHYGISSIRPNVINSFCEKSNIVSDMLQYSLLDRRPEENVLSQLKENKVGVMVRGALAKGLLAGKEPTNYLEHNMESISELQQKMQTLAGDNMSSSHIALKYVLNSEAVTSAVVGIRTIKQLQDVIKSQESRELSSEEITQLSSAVAAHEYTKHRIS
jgi:aryl-alcohol dehydrogenase-like predicted oxidoreductase